jgi:hypothetical protein
MGGQLERAKWRIAICLGVAVAVAVAMAIVFELGGYPSAAVLADVAATAELPFWYGAGAAIGVVLWAAMAAACGLAASVLAALGARAGAEFFAVSGALLGFLCLDDALQLHEGGFPQTLGVSQPQVYAAYGLVAAAWAWRYRRRLLAADRLLLAAAGAALTTSVAIDLRSGGVPEEYFKLVGLGIGGAFWGRECHRAVLAAARRGGTARPAGAGAPGPGSDLARG